MSGGNGVSAPVPEHLTITDDDDTPVVTLALSPTSIREDDELSTVTASLSAPSSEAVKVMIAATADSPAVSGDFQIRANTDLTIAAGRTESFGDGDDHRRGQHPGRARHDGDGDGIVTGGNGAAPPEAETLTIENKRRDADGDAEARFGVDRRERRGEHGDGVADRGVEASASR